MAAVDLVATVAGRLAALRRLGLALQIGLSRARAVRWLAIASCTAGLAGLTVLDPADAGSSEAAVQLRQQVSRARAALRASPAADSAATTATGAGAQEAQRLAAFEARLGDPGTVEAQLARILALARQGELELAQADYRWLVDEAAATERVVVQMPLKGSYTALRGFLAQVLSELPHASLDDLALRRQGIGDDTLSATLRLSLHLHPGVASTLAARRPAVGAPAPQTARATRP